MKRPTTKRQRLMAHINILSQKADELYALAERETAAGRRHNETIYLGADYIRECVYLATNNLIKTRK